MKPLEKYSLLFILLLAVTAIVLACWHIAQPGLYYDELLFVNAAVGGKSDLFINRRVLGIPLLLMDYIGALKAWIFYPVFALFGVNEWSVRFPAILIGIAGGGMLVAALWRGFGPLAAVAGAVLILLDPTMIIHSRLDWGPNALMFFFRGLLVLSVVNWARTMSVRWAWIGIAAAAIGIFDKLNFIWMAGATTGALVIVYFDNIKAFRRRYPKKALLLAGIAVGGLVAAVMRGVMMAEHANSTWGDRFVQAIGLIRITLSGGGALNFISGEGARTENLFWLSYIPALLIGIWGVKQIFKDDFQKRLFIWLVVLCGAVAAAFILTKTATGPHHASMLCGLWQMMLAPLIGVRWNKLAAKLPALNLIPVVSLLCVAIGSIAVTTICIRAFAKPINANWEPANFKAAQLAKKYTDANFICTDWGMGTLAVGLSKKHENINDNWPSFTNRDEAVNIIKNINRQQDTYIFTLLVPFENFKGNGDNLRYALQVNNIKPQVEAAFFNWEGKPMIEVLKVSALPQ